MKRKTVLVTGANGYIGGAIARAFVRAGWRTFGSIRKPEQAIALARQEIHPVIGSPDDVMFLTSLEDTVFDVVVSNTEDWSNIFGHYEHVLAMLRAIGERGARAGVRPLLMFTSGCKDYGHMSVKHGDAGLAPHTEESPLSPPSALIARTNTGVALLGSGALLYDATVLRPTIVYGYSSSLYGALFQQAAQSRGILQLTADPNATMHSVHVDDCAEAYVSLAEHGDRDAVAGQAFNISNRSYDTARSVGEALASSYGLGLEFIAPTEDVSPGSFPSLTNFWQWVSSEKLRALTGWAERRAGFVEGIEEYRLGYEASLQA